MNLSSILPKLGLAASLTQDVTLLIVVILASFLFGVFISKSRLAAVLIYAYVAFALVSVTPSVYLADYTYKILAFLIVIVIGTIWTRRIIDVGTAGLGPGTMWKVFVLSFLEVVLILSVVISLMPKRDALAYISVTSYGYLATDPMKLAWMAAPLLFLFLTQRRR